MKYFIIHYKNGFYEYMKSNSIDDVISSLKVLGCFKYVKEIKQIN